jgi:hypothetical protein
MCSVVESRIRARFELFVKKFTYTIERLVVVADWLRYFLF